VSRLSLRTFLNAAYTILFEEALRIGVPLEAALRAVSLWREGGPPVEEQEIPAGGNKGQRPRRREEDVVAQNQAGLAQIMAKMPGGLRL
jgi:hypothetical protein